MVLDEKKGTSYSKGYEHLGFAGALLMDLFLNDRISFTENRIEVIDLSSTGEELLDQILEDIKNSENKRSIMNWIDNLSQKDTYIYSFFDTMEQEGILKSENSSDLNTKLFYLQKPEIKSQFLEIIHNVVSNKKSPSIDIICLLTLLEESKLIKIYLPRDLRKKARSRIKESLNSERLDSLKKEMVLRIKKEIVNVIGARNMFLTDES
ncbi:MAG: GPP34 family phosphoprotein [Promethearchaeota archaeon]